MASMMETPTQPPRTRRYMVFLLFYMILYDIIDSYSTNHLTMVITYILEDFGITIKIFYNIQAIASIGLYFVIFIQNLADRVGRKPIIIVVFFGMGLANLIIFLAHQVVWFTIGYFMLWIFFSSDMWVVILAEESPKNTRARLTYLVLVFGTIGSILIMVARLIFIKSEPIDDPSQWRAMNYIPISAMIFAFVGLFIHETQPFLEKRQLTKKSQISFTQQIKQRFTLFAQPFQLKFRTYMIIFLIIGFLLGCATAATTTVENYLSKELGLDSQMVSNLIMWASVGTIVLYVIAGPLSDFIGRRALVVTYSLIYTSGFIAVVVFAPLLIMMKSFIILGILIFFAQGSFWGLFATGKAYCVECFPTPFRATAAGWRSFAYAIGITIGSLISAQLSEEFLLGKLYMITSIVVTIIIIPLVLWKLPETKGISLE